MKKILYLCLLFCVIGCNLNDTKENNPTKEDLLMNDIKWAMYYLNYQQEAYQMANFNIKLNSSIQCSLVCRSIDTLSEDSIIFCCSYTDSGNINSRYQLIYPDSHDYKHDLNTVYGIGVVNGKIAYPIFGGVQFEFPDSNQIFMKKHEQGFIKYLQSYPNKAEIDRWLLNEAKRRKILK